MFVIHDWGGWLILLASSGVWADTESENDCFSALSFADEQMWECVYDREAETDGFRVRVMNGLKACSSWSLYDDRYDMTNILVTSNDEGEREWEWIKRSSWRGWMKKSDVWIWVAHWVVKKNEKKMYKQSLKINIQKCLMSVAGRSLRILKCGRINEEFEFVFR